MIRKVISFALLLILLSANVYAHTAIIESKGDNRYKAVRLTPEIYSNANAGLSDILIKDARGENVPYFINNGYRTEYAAQLTRHSMSLINSYVKDDKFYFDYKVTELPGHDVPATSIEFTTNNSSFVKNIEVFGSYDDIHWERVQDDKLFQVDGKSKLEIFFNSPQKYTHYRFRLSNNLERISFNTVALKNNTETSQTSYYIESLRPRFRTEEKDKVTYIHIEGLKKLRLAEMTIETDSMFQRVANISVLGVRKELYNLTFGDTVYTDTTMDLGFGVHYEDVLTLTIDNADDKPIHIKGISVKYYADELVFEGGSDRYTLHFGTENLRAPVYDIEKYKNEILKGDIDRLDIKEVIFEAPEEIQVGDFNKIFNIVVIVVAVLLAVLILMRMRKKS